MQNRETVASPSIRVMVTGGGTSGHVTPALAVIERGRDRGWTVDYVGSKKGIEKGLVEDAGLPFHSIPVGKLRRYFSVQNFLDPFLVLAGVVQATVLVRRLKPQVVFSKGGFVSFPVVVGAWANGVPVVAHESDTTPGLANRISMPFIQVLCVASEETRAHVRGRARIEVTGSPLRKALFEGSKERALRTFRLDPELQTLLVFGGSLGAATINAAIRSLLPKLDPKLQVIHVCGKGNLAPELEDHPRYRQFEYLKAEFPDALAAADLAVCRAGANSIAELVALGVPAIMVPLSASQSRGDQLVNAERYVESGFGWRVLDEDLNAGSLAEAIEVALQDRQRAVDAMKASPESSAAETIASIVESLVR